jgi:hypothetical protein
VFCNALFSFVLLFVFSKLIFVAKVYSLPPAQRDAKIAMVKKYGSPNVFSQFEPHLTIAYVVCFFSRPCFTLLTIGIRLSTT